MSERWILRLGDVQEAVAPTRLLCLPFAGGAAAVFRNWPARMGPEITVWPIQLPGRGARLSETPRTRILGLVGEIAEALEPQLDGRYALFGYSLGALVALELARELRARCPSGPVHLFVCARRAPSLPCDEPKVADLPDGEFVEEVRRRYDAMPDEVVREPELLRLLLPSVRADFTMLETYEYARAEPLDCPITALFGSDDPRTRADDLDGWALETRRGFSKHRFDGGHFFFRECEPALTDLVRRTLLADAGAVQ